MAMCTAKIIEDSVSPGGIRLTTMQLRYPRFIHAEFMTHRVFSRNASSSRAIPVAKMIEQVRNDPAMPVHWGKNQPGMQANEQFTGEDAEACKKAWLIAARNAASMAEAMNEFGLHKQVANRILEPFQFISVIVTATHWDNFFALRAHTDAQPEIHDLAIVMKAAMDDSEPKVLKQGEWHLPYVSAEERGAHDIGTLVKLSAARCARVSYLTHDGQQPNILKDIELFERLVGSEPLHASPIEHQATPDSTVTLFIGDTSGDNDEVEDWKHPAWHGNFEGWVQFRKMFEAGEKITSSVNYA